MNGMDLNGPANKMEKTPKRMSLITILEKTALVLKIGEPTIKVL
jgi:hypothetical protein